MSEQGRGRPRKQWEGPLGAFVSSFRVESLAIELGIEPASVYGWMRGEYRPSIDRAFQIVEVARRSGTTLTLEDVYVRGIKPTDEENHARILSKATAQNRT